jgi:hypothetical protein
MEPTLRAATSVPVFISIFSTPAATEPFKPNVFRTGPLNDRLQGIAVADFVLDELKGQKVALAQQSDEYGRRGGASLTARLRERGKPLVATEVFNLTDTDFTSRLRMRGADRMCRIYGFGTGGRQRAMRAARPDCENHRSNATSNRTIRHHRPGRCGRDERHHPLGAAGRQYPHAGSAEVHARRNWRAEPADLGDCPLQRRAGSPRLRRADRTCRAKVIHAEGIRISRPGRSPTTRAEPARREPFGPRAGVPA